MFPISSPSKTFLSLEFIASSLKFATEYSTKLLPCVVRRYKSKEIGDRLQALSFRNVRISMVLVSHGISRSTMDILRNLPKHDKYIMQPESVS